ncbi:MAG: 30S ribosomal protein S6 [Defluviitaleaceae bacterium]|nr:30S ribosomal protein S6 [Defluviitaleaceae bacterium]MCL2837335.1 30S ribosomal protein S6 [Defluviitaleaceae bacterium]
MHKYELAVILDPNLDEDGLKAEFDKVTALVTRFNGTVEKVDDWGKRRLAYEIDKKNEGFYYFITINAEPSAPREIEDRIRIMENVLRYLIIRVDE